MTYRNARGSDDDRRQILADLISSDDSPFTPDDADALGMMTDESLTAMRDRWLKKGAKAQARRTNCGIPGVTAAELRTMVTAAVAEALAEHGPTTNDAKSESRRAIVEKQARSMLSQLGVAKPTDAQVSAIVDALIAQLDGDDGAESGTSGDAEVMSTANVAEELAREAELAGDTRKAAYLRNTARIERDNDERRARSAAHAARANAIARVNHTDSNDPAVKAMTEFNGPEAFAKALAAKRERDRK